METRSDRAPMTHLQIAAVRTAARAVTTGSLPVYSILLAMAARDSIEGGLSGPLIGNLSLNRAAFALLLAATGIWIRYSLFRRRAKPSTAVAGALMVVSSAGMVFLGLPYPFLLFCSFSAVTLTLATLYPIPGALFGQAAAAALHCGGLLAAGASALAAVFLTQGVLLGLITYAARRALHGWEKQSVLFEQAKWAAVEIARANARLQDERNRTEMQTRSRERERVAREIHDTVGHTLTAVLVQIDALQVDFARHPKKAMERLSKLEGMVRGALQDVRAEVSTLREEASRKESWKTRWLKLCATFADSTGIRVNAEFSDDLYGLDDGEGEALYRVIQEALTNSYRHGRATMVDVAAGRKEGSVIARISDNGSGADAVVPGNGLTGMRERVAALGGEIAWQTLPMKGFDVGIVFPWKGKPQ